MRVGALSTWYLAHSEGCAELDADMPQEDELWYKTSYYVNTHVYEGAVHFFHVWRLLSQCGFAFKGFAWIV